MSILVFQESSAWRMFHLGRARGGNLGVPRSDDGGPLPNALWFDQTLDHFDHLDVRTWSQRYFVNDTFWERGGPVFLMIGGEGPANAMWMKTGSWIDYARSHKALCFLLEHRYYGKSHPTPDLKVKNLRWLSSEQALADLASFITAMNEVYSVPAGTRWVAFGGSYPGSLAAWLRAKYPHLVHASVSTSGPLLAKADFKEYYDVVWDSLASQSPECVSTLVAATSQIEALTRTKKGLSELQTLFKLCEPLNTTSNNKIDELDLAAFFETLAGNLAGIVQYSGDNREFEGAKGVNITIPVACSVLQNSSLGAPVRRVATLNSLLLTAYNTSCLDYTYKSTIQQLRDYSWSAAVAEGGRQWMWQTCTEFGFYQTSSGKPDLLGNYFPLEYFVRQCADVFGPRYNGTLLQHAIDQTNIEYGGLAVDTSRVVFVHGSVDPWHALGITHTLLPKCPAIYIKGTAHCANMYPAAPSDLPQLKAARKMIDSLLTQWLS
ncbi:hypothetical protein R5R35_007892 [Gryllus longicercus]